MSNLPAYLQNKPVGPRISQAVVANIGSGALPFVSIKGNRFTLVDAGGDSEPVQTAANGLPYLDCVIIDALERESKIYYAKPFDPASQSFAPPDCWSDNGIGPSRLANPAPALGCGPTCAACPKAVWGSATSKVSGKGIPACAKNQKLALMIPGDDVLFLLRVPPNSLENLRNCMRKFEGQQFDVNDVVTRISFEADTLGTLTFTPLMHIDDPRVTHPDLIGQRNKALAAKATDLLVGRTDLPREGFATPLAAPQAPAQLAAPTAAAPLTGAAPAPIQTAPLAPAASPSEAPAGARRGRKPKTPEAAPQAGQTAPFMESPAPSANGGPTENFGIAPGVPLNAELASALDNIFGPGK